jgi:hypothetical protein
VFTVGSEGTIVVLMEVEVHGTEKVLFIGKQQEEQESENWRHGKHDKLHPL